MKGIGRKIAEIFTVIWRVAGSMSRFPIWKSSIFIYLSYWAHFIPVGQGYICLFLALIRAVFIVYFLNYYVGLSIHHVLKMITLGSNTGTKRWRHCLLGLSIIKVVYTGLTACMTYAVRWCNINFVMTLDPNHKIKSSLKLKKYFDKNVFCW